jgi:hypothetical protein
MPVQVTRYLGFVIADEGYPRGSVATMKLTDGSFAELAAEPGDDISRVIDDWWCEHGEAEVAASGRAADTAIAALSEKAA